MRWKVPAILLPVVLCASSAAWSAGLVQAKALVEEGRSVEALSELDRHLAEAPSDSEAMFLRGLVLAEMKRETEAESVFERVSDLRPDRPEPLNNLAVLQAAQGDYDRAVETLKEALQTHPAYRTAYENLTKIYGQLASEAYSRALSVEEAHDRSQLELVLLSRMVQPEPAPVLLAEADPTPEPAQPDPEPAAAIVTPPLPAAPKAGTGTVEAMSWEDPAGSEGGSAEQGAISPETAIVEAMRQDPGSATELAALVEAWALAWSEQRVDDYLAFYSPRFQPAGDLGYEEWRELRRQRVSAPEYVEVSVAFLEFDNSEPNRALVRFNQSYESDTFSDVVTKALELVRQDGTWKIVTESVDS